MNIAVNFQQALAFNQAGKEFRFRPQLKGARQEKTSATSIAEVKKVVASPARLTSKALHESTNNKEQVNA